MLFTSAFLAFGGFAITTVIARLSAIFILRFLRKIVKRLTKNKQNIVRGPIPSPTRFCSLYWVQIRNNSIKGDLK